jgi:hypothetical protein
VPSAEAHRPSVQCARAWPWPRVGVPVRLPVGLPLPPAIVPQTGPEPPVLTQVRSVPPLRLRAQVQIVLEARVVLVPLRAPTQTPPAGPRSTAPKGGREGPDSLFTGDRRQPINEELLGATYRGGSPLQRDGALCCVTKASYKGSARAPGGACAPVVRGVRGEHRGESWRFKFQPTSPLVQ